MSPKTIQEFFANDHASIEVLAELIEKDAPIGADWTKQNLINLTDLFSECLDGSSADEGVEVSSLIEIMEQLASSDNGQLLRRLQTVMAAGIDEFASFYKDIKLEPR